MLATPKPCHAEASPRRSLASPGRADFGAPAGCKHLGDIKASRCVIAMTLLTETELPADASLSEALAGALAASVSTILDIKGEVSSITRALAERGQTR
jgi:hypothetical protein